MIVIPIEPYASDPVLLKALCAYRETRSEPYGAQLAVCRVIDNRVALAPVQGFKHTITDNILHPWAFSSFMSSDSNSSVYPQNGPTDQHPVWQSCLAAANSTEPDNTGGATFYYGPPATAPPNEWPPVEETVQIGVLHFCRIVS